MGRDSAKRLESFIDDGENSEDADVLEDPGRIATDGISAGPTSQTFEHENITVADRFQTDRPASDFVEDGLIQR